jgi:predicted RNA-binding Zn ribbon-like protein
MPLQNDRAFHSELGAPSLHFAATLGGRHRVAPVERLSAPSRLGEWFSGEGLLSTAPPVAPEELAEAVVLREAIFRTVTAAMRGEPLPSRDVATINSFADDEPPHAVLRSDGTAVRTSLVPVRAALAAIARDAIDVVTRRARELRVCEGEDCSGIFLDASHGKRRRWCSMSRCGNRAKVSAYRKRAGNERRLTR